jgi:membrane-bound metal-dependent hydrolase YbcI (DUF457 family)
MRWQSQIIIGALAAAVASYFLGFDNLILLAIIGGLAALLPDLDHDTSKGRKILDFTVIILSFVVVYMKSCSGQLCVPDIQILITWLGFLGLYFLIFWFFKPKHRGITHTLLAAIFVAIAGYLILGYEYAAVILIGYLSHLIADGVFKVI